MRKNAAKNIMKKECVVLLHGILRSKTDMLPLMIYLKKHGYHVVNILYPSRKQNLEELVEFVDEKIKTAKEYQPGHTLHFVTHSMGGLITRYYIHEKRPENLGKVVMMGTPNTGSEFADFLNDHKLFGSMFQTVFGPAGQQLVTTYEHVKDDIDYPLGIIAGNQSINPLAAFILPGEHDGIVPVERTRIKGMTDHITMKANHTTMMFTPGIMKQVKVFLEKGKFIPQDSSESKSGSRPSVKS